MEGGAPTACRQPVSGSISLPSPGFFSPFPHGTKFTIGRGVVFSLGGWSPQIPTGFLVPRGTRERSPGREQGFRLRGCHPLWLAFPDHSANLLFCNSPRAPGRPPATSHNPELATPLGLAPVRFRLLPFRSPLLRESRLISFPPGTEMVHFPGFASSPKRRCSDITRNGFPHSEIHGSKPAYGSPWLIAANHVLPRFPAPRHPLYALSSLTTKFYQTSLHRQQIVKDLFYTSFYNDCSDYSLVENTGLEPVTPGLQNRCSPS